MRDTVLAALTAFLVEHQYCGELDGGRDDGAIWLACSCGARVAHPSTALQLDALAHPIERPYLDERHSR
jgi:hypothetical protein